MGTNFFVKTTCLLFWLHFINIAKAETFNVKTYGAVGNGRTDDSQAITNAWKDACASPNASEVVIGGGNYMVNSLNFQGPCKSPVTIQVQGTLKAPASVQGSNSRGAWITFQHIDGLTVFGGGTFDGQGAIAWSKNDCAKTGKCSSLPINLSFNGLKNSKIQGITSLNSKLFHMNILNCQNVTLENIVITAPQNSLNTDGIHIGRSTGINVTGANIKTGDDCVSLGDGSQQINIEKVTCGPGHGISIGSLGRYHDEQPVTGITVRNCTLTSTMNGVRIKTWPASPSGIASNLHFEDIIMNNVSNPILIDQEYCPYNECELKIPSRVKIYGVTFKGIHGTSATQVAVKLVCSGGVPCQNVAVEDVSLTYNGAGGNRSTSVCKNVKPQVSGNVVPPPCANSP